MQSKRGESSFYKEVVIIKQLKKIMTALLFAYLPSVFIIAAWIGGDGDFFDTPFAFDFLIVLLYTLPVLIGIVEVITCVLRISEREKRSPRVMVYHAIKMLVAVGAVILILVCKELIYISLILSALLVTTELIHGIRSRRRLNIASLIKQPSFWVIVVAILLTVTLCASTYRYFAGTKNRVDDLDGLGNESNIMTAPKEQISEQTELFDES